MPVNRSSLFFRGTEGTSPDELLHAAKVLLWVRWFALTAAFWGNPLPGRILVSEPHTQYLRHPGDSGANGYVQWLIHRRGTVKPAWLLCLSALDLAFISFSTSISGGFNRPYLPAYYFAVAAFAYVFTSLKWVLPWTTLVAVVYSVLSFMTDPGVDIGAKGKAAPLLPGIVPLCRCGRGLHGGQPGAGTASALSSPGASTTLPPCGPA